MAKKNSVKARQSHTNGSADAGNDGQWSNGLAFNREEMISNDEIAARAYEIYEREGRGEGRALDHWLQAESELRSERQRPESPRDSRIGGAPPERDIPQSARLLQQASGA